MKKFLFTAIVTSLILAGCSSTNIVNNPKSDKKITWEVGGHLPAQKGYEKNIGTAGVLYGCDEKMNWEIKFCHNNFIDKLGG